MAEMEFCLLGPLVIRAGTVAVQVPHGKQRSVLAALLLKANRVLSLDELTETLWGRDPPPSARAAIHNHVMRLRKIMGDEGSRIITQPPGYLIRVNPGELDVTRFQGHLDTARAAARDNSWDAAAIAARAALSLYRGEPLADVGSEALRLHETPRLAELRLQALETRIDADLHLGRHAEVITELRQLTGTHPLRERLHRQLMLALYRDGRQAEALSAYQDARKVLVQEVGTEPGTEVRELHRQILTADASLAVPERMPTAGDQTGRAAPRELPAAVAPFVGRATELAALTGLLDRRDELMPGTLVISVIGGPAGVGKTALVVRWAHQVAGRFPDGQLYVNLRGYDPGQPMSTSDALAGALRSLGVPGQDIPPETEERAARYRSLLADKRMLIVLDNAGSADQVRPLLPGTLACAVVATSRDALAGLVARDGAVRLDLDVLPLEEAVALLRALIGARVDNEPEAAAALAAQCCLLPLALRVAAELAASRPAVPLARLAGELADLRTRLDLLASGGDPHTQVRTVFSWSYRQLDPGDARTFHLLGLHPGPNFEPYAAAALSDVTLRQANQMLDVLARTHLIHSPSPGRYGLHDLLRAYARELAASCDAREFHEALTRLFDYYLGTATAAMDTLIPAERDRRPRVPRPGTPFPAVTSVAAARAWLDAERANLVEVAAYTAARGWPGHATRLAATLFRYLESGGCYPELSAIQSHACRAARDVGDPAAEALALHSLSIIELRQGRYRQAADKLRQVLVVCRQTGDRALEARTLCNLGITGFLQGRYQQAIGYYQQAVAAYLEAGDRAGTRHTLNNLGLVELRQGRYEQASTHLHQALAVLPQASDHSEANALSNLGVISLRLGRCQEASEYLSQALARCRESGDQSSEAEVLNGLGEVCLATRRTGDAMQEYAAALSLASKLGDKYEQARACDGLARSYYAVGDPARARRHWEEALALYTALGVPEADQVSAEMAKADHDDHPES